MSKDAFYFWSQFGSWRMLYAAMVEGRVMETEECWEKCAGKGFCLWVRETGIDCSAVLRSMESQGVSPVLKKFVEGILNDFA